MKYETIIGLEVHAQLLTNSKIFCGCSTKFGAAPNSQTCPVCLGLPGALPVVNRKAVEFGIKMALAVHCDVNERSLFARKNYFYPDLPKGYQISQYEDPLAENGWIEIEPGGNTGRRIGIRRIHLEEDAGKSVHAEAYVSDNESLLDFNRCGIPLIEIVSDPDVRSPAEARKYLSKLRRILRWLEICDGNMEEGSLRCDANISVRPEGSGTLGVKTELKNMNSFRGVERALTYEARRQVRLLEMCEEVVRETMLWDEAKGVAVSMRGKEATHDYRYFPDPDLVPLIIKNEWVEESRCALPELPDERERRWLEDFGLSKKETSVLLEEKGVADYFEVVAENVKDKKQAANWVMGEVLRTLKESKLGIEALRLRPDKLAEIICMVEDGKISHTAAKAVFEEGVRSGMSPQKAVERLGLIQISDPAEIETIVEQIVRENPEEVSKFLRGREGVFGYLMGQVMKAMRGRANPRVARDILKRKLDKMT